MPKPILSSFINIGINYMKQAAWLWNEMFQIAKGNCSTEYAQDDLIGVVSVSHRTNPFFHCFAYCMG